MVALQLKLKYATHLAPKMYLMTDKIKITWNLNWLKVKKEPTNKINGQLQDTQKIEPETWQDLFTFPIAINVKNLFIQMVIFLKGLKNRKSLYDLG